MSLLTAIGLTMLFGLVAFVQMLAMGNMQWRCIEWRYNWWLLTLLVGAQVGFSFLLTYLVSLPAYTIGLPCTLGWILFGTPGFLLGWRDGQRMLPNGKGC